MTSAPSKLRIAFLLDRFPVVSETFILRQITGLIDLGHEVDIYAEWSHADPLLREPHALIHPEVHRYGLLRRTTYVDMPLEAGYWGLPVVPLTGRSWNPGSERSQLNALRAVRALPDLLRCLVRAPALTMELLSAEAYGRQAATLAPIHRMAALARRRRRYDIVHAHFGPLGHRFRFARRLFGCAFVVSFHGYDFSSWPQSRGEDAYRDLFAEADAVTAVSEYARARLLQLGCPSQKIYRLPMGVDPAEFAYRPQRCTGAGPIHVLTIARLVEKKGLEYSLRAFAAARREHERLHYDIVGDGPLGEQLAALARELGVSEAVTLHGALDSARTRAMMNEADLFVLASVTAKDGDQEGAPVVLMEAQASGLPVVSTWHSGIPEVVPDGASGLLVPERDVDALTAALLRLLRSPESWPAMGRRGREHVEENYDVRKLTEKQVQLYRGLQSNPALPARPSLKLASERTNGGEGDIRTR